MFGVDNVSQRASAVLGYLSVYHVSGKTKYYLDDKKMQGGFSTGKSLRWMMELVAVVTRRV